MSAVAVSSQDEQIVVFKLLNESYGIDIFRVNEIIRMRDITPVPKTQPHVRGLVNLRGKTIPVLDLRSRLGLEISPDNEETRIIVVESSDGLVGVIVDEVSEVITLQPDEIEATPGLVASVGTEYVRAVAKRDARLITLLALDMAIQN